MRFAAAAVAVTLGAAACVTAPAPTALPPGLDPIQLAVLYAPTRLAAEAQGGAPAAQLAFSLVLSHGLNGVGADPEQAALWRARYLAGDQTQPRQVTQYMPGVNGAPGRVSIILIPPSRARHIQLAAVEACIERLSVGQNLRSAGLAADLSGWRACGDEAQTARLEALWATSAVAAAPPPKRP